MITICMTNGGNYANVNSINGHDTSNIKPEILTKMLENDKFINIILNNG